MRLLGGGFTSLFSRACCNSQLARKWGNMSYFHPEPWGRWIQFDLRIFPNGLEKNHQLGFCWATACDVNMVSHNMTDSLPPRFEDVPLFFRMKSIDQTHLYLTWHSSTGWPHNDVKVLEYFSMFFESWRFTWGESYFWWKKLWEMVIRFL